MHVEALESDLGQKAAEFVEEKKASLLEMEETKAAMDGTAMKKKPKKNAQ